MRTSRLFIGILAFVCFPSGFIYAEQPVHSRSLVCRRTTLPPKIDGDLSDTAWEDAQSTADFISLGTKDVPEVKPSYPVEDQTTVRALYDGRCLYFAFECKAPGRDKFRMIQGGRDVNFLAAEAVELFLSPRPELGIAYQLAVNPENAQLDAQLRDGEFDTKWNAEWQSAVARRPGMWTVELAIPFKALGADLSNTGGIWSVNFRRNHSGWHQMSAWSNPVEPRLSDVRTYGHLLFVEPSDACSLASLSCPLLAPWGENAIRLSLSGATAGRQKISLSIDRGRVRRALPGETGKTVEVNVPLTKSGRTEVGIEGLARRARFNVWADELLSLRLETVLVAKRQGVVRGEVRLNARHEFLKMLTVKARLDDSAGKRVEHVVAALSSPLVPLALSVSDLSPGVCRFQVDVSRDDRGIGRVERKFDLMAGDLPF